MPINVPSETTLPIGFAARFRYQEKTMRIIDYMLTKPLNTGFLTENLRKELNLTHHDVQWALANIFSYKVFTREKVHFYCEGWKYVYKVRPEYVPALRAFLERNKELY